MEFMYVIGSPGSGKSTLVKELTKDCEKRLSREPVPNITWMTSTYQIVEIGYERDSFRGTDATPMSVQPAAIRYVQGRPTDLMLAEGDRLATSGFLSAVQTAGYELTVVHLAPPASVAEERRKARATELGVPSQNQTWVNGRITKVRNLARQWALNAERYVLVDAPDLDEIVDRVCAASKVAATLRHG